MIDITPLLDAERKRMEDLFLERIDKKIDILLGEGTISPEIIIKKRSGKTIQINESDLRLLFKTDF